MMSPLRLAQHPRSHTARTLSARRRPRRPSITQCRGGNATKMPSWSPSSTMHAKAGCQQPPFACCIASPWPRPRPLHPQPHARGKLTWPALLTRWRPPSPMQHAFRSGRCMLRVAACCRLLVGRVVSRAACLASCD